MSYSLGSTPWWWRWTTNQQLRSGSAPVPSNCLDSRASCSISAEPAGSWSWEPGRCWPWGSGGPLPAGGCGSGVSWRLGTRGSSGKRRAEEGWPRAPGLAKPCSGRVVARSIQHHGKVQARSAAPGSSPAGPRCGLGAACGPGSCCGPCAAPGPGPCCRPALPRPRVGPGDGQRHRAAQRQQLPIGGAKPGVFSAAQAPQARGGNGEKCRWLPVRRRCDLPGRWLPAQALPQPPVARALSPCWQLAPP